MTQKHVVTIGGGNGSANVITALKPYVKANEIEVSAVVAMSDSGGSSGRLRKEFDVLPPGDLMRAILAMSRYPYRTLKNIFYRPRFEHCGRLDGHNIGNLFLTLATKYDGSLEHAVRAMLQGVQAVGDVYPVTLESSDLCVELDDGAIVIGEHEIDRPKKRDAKIARAWLQPTPMLYAPAKQAIEEADVIVMGPGSLYCSIIAPLVVEGMKKQALRHSSAKFIFVAGNAYEKQGEAGPETLLDAVTALEQYLPRPLDVIFHNNHSLSEAEEAYYRQRQWEILTYDSDAEADDRIISRDFERQGGGFDHKKLGDVLMDYMRNI